MENYDINFTFYPLGRAIAQTMLGNSDLVFNATENEERKKWGIYVPTEMIPERYVFFARAESKFNIGPYLENVDQLVLGTMMHFSYGKGIFSDALENNLFFAVEEAKTAKQLVDMLINSRTDVFIGNYHPIMYYLKSNCLLGKVRIVKAPGKKEDLVIINSPTYILVSKNSNIKNLASKLNVSIESMKKDKSFQDIVKRYEKVLSMKPSCPDQANFKNQ